jgi:hypothetical protein
VLNYKSVKSERQWKAVTGLSSMEFHSLCHIFIEQYEKLHQLSIKEISSNLNTTLLLSTYEDCLFFVLFQLKNALSYDSLGLLIGTDSGNAQRNFERYLSILESALLQLGTLPKREFKNIDEFEEYFKEHKDLILDATEHATQRPKGYDAQKEVYSGKKRHTQTKNL